MELFSVVNLMIAGLLSGIGYIKWINRRDDLPLHQGTLNPNYQVHSWKEEIVKLPTRKLTDSDLKAYFNKDFSLLEHDIMRERDMLNFGCHYSDIKTIRSFTPATLVKKIRQLQKDGLI